MRGEGIHATISEIRDLYSNDIALMAGMMVSLNIDLDVHVIVSERHSK